MIPAPELDTIEGLRRVGDRALRIDAQAGTLAEAGIEVRARFARLSALDAPEIEDLVPAARSLLVVLRPGLEPSPALLRALSVPTAPDAAPIPARTLELEVRYGGEHGPDLGDVARAHGLSAARVVELHAGALYTVAFLGFMPGFPYLTGLPDTLHTPRLSTPRTRVPAGSVAIGGELSGIYPRESPGGWRLIGRIDRPLFRIDADPPALLRPGDQLRFLPR